MPRRSLMRSLPRARLVVVWCFAVSACADITPPLRFNTVDYLIGESSGALSGLPTSLVVSLAPLVAPPFTSTCPYNPTSTLFECEPVTDAVNRTYTVSFQLLNAVGQPVSAWDATVVDAVRTLRTSDGAYLGYQGWRMRSDRTIHGLLSGARIVESRDTVQKTINVPGFYMRNTDVMVLTGFRPRVQNLPGSVPSGGTISVQRSLAPDSTVVPTVQETSLFTFDGTPTVAWVRTVAGVVNTCTFPFGGTTIPKCP